MPRVYPPRKPPIKIVTLRLPEPLCARVEAQVKAARRAAVETGLGIGQVTRAGVMRRLLELGLAQMMEVGP